MCLTVAYQGVSTYVSESQWFAELLPLLNNSFHVGPATLPSRHTNYSLLTAENCINYKLARADKIIFVANLVILIPLAGNEVRVS